MLNTLTTSLIDTATAPLGTSIGYTIFSPFFPPYFPPYFPPFFDPCAGQPAAGTYIGQNCQGNYLQQVYADGCGGQYVGSSALTWGYCGYPCPGGGLCGCFCAECGGFGGYECIYDGCGNFIGCND